MTIEPGTTMRELDGAYGTIVIDPPWRYENDRGTQTRARRGRKSAVAAGHYSVMDNAEIAALPVGDPSADGVNGLGPANGNWFGSASTDFLAVLERIAVALETLAKRSAL